eukprot:19309-Pelagococcus_subviridis.AAC.1
MRDVPAPVRRVRQRLPPRQRLVTLLVPSDDVPANLPHDPPRARRAHPPLGHQPRRPQRDHVAVPHREDVAQALDRVRGAELDELLEVPSRSRPSELIRVRAVAVQPSKLIAHGGFGHPRHDV